MRYRVSDIGESGKNNGLATVPTVLDSRLSSFFCPTPTTMKYEQTLDLASGNDDRLSLEIIHKYLPYKLEYIYKAGFINKPLGKTLEKARKLHLDYILDDFENKEVI